MKYKPLKSRFAYDLPNMMAYFVYAYAKLSMLQYVYDFLDKFIDQSKYQFLQMDTVSLSCTYCISTLCVQNRIFFAGLALYGDFPGLTLYETW